ncbi:MAG TPA: cell envelope integrity protein TolA [Candidatus Binatia bacterium]|nr:cell envelope integrity protein TolA [Candidatus Binatia bacterium]
MTKAPQRNAWIADRAVEPALPWMVVLSAVLHVAGGVIVAVLPRGIFMHAPAPVVAYTVTIVDPSALGGRLPKGEIRPETPPSGVAAPAPKQEPKPEAKPEPPPEPVEKKPEPPTREESVVTLPDVPKKPEPKPEEKKPPPPKPKPADVKPKLSKAELARLERDKEIQEAVRQLGEKGKGKHASGLGGVEEGKGAALGTGGEGGGGGVLMGLDFIIYKNQVEAIIKKNWTWVGANPDLTIRVGFRIGDGGDITDVRVLDRSGDSSFDDSVLRAIRISTPLPAPPGKYRQIFGDYTLEFVSGQLAAGG